MAAIRLTLGRVALDVAGLATLPLVDAPWQAVMAFLIFTLAAQMIDRWLANRLDCLLVDKTASNPSMAATAKALADRKR